MHPRPFCWRWGCPGDPRHRGFISSRPGAYSVGEAKRGITAPMCSTKSNIISRTISRLVYEYVLCGPCVTQALNARSKWSASIGYVCLFQNKKVHLFSQNRLYFFSAVMATCCAEAFSEYNRVYKAFPWLSYQFLVWRVVSCFLRRLLEALSPIKAVLALHDSWILIFTRFLNLKR